MVGDKISDEAKSVKVKSRQFRVEENGTLWRHVGVGDSTGGRWLLVPKLNERERILKEVHDGHGHNGCQSTWSRLYVNYLWSNSYEKIKLYIKSCYLCQLAERKPRREAPNKMDVMHIFERWGVDYLGPFTESEKGNFYIIVAVEYYTKWPVARVVKVADSENAVPFLYDEIFSVFGPIKKFLTEGGSHFDNIYVKNLAEYGQAKHNFAAGYHPETNGLTERFNGTLVAQLKKLAFFSPRKWDTHLNAILYSYRTRAHSVLKISPYELMFGIAPQGVKSKVGDYMNELSKKLNEERSYALMNERLNYDLEFEKNTLISTQKFKVEDFVLRVNRRRKNKLDMNYLKSPYIVIAIYANDCK